MVFAPWYPRGFKLLAPFVNPQMPTAAPTSRNVTLRGLSAGMSEWDGPGNEDLARAFQAFTEPLTHGFTINPSNFEEQASPVTVTCVGFHPAGNMDEAKMQKLQSL